MRSLLYGLFLAILSNLFNLHKTAFSKVSEGAELEPVVKIELRQFLSAMGSLLHKILA